MPVVAQNQQQNALWPLRRGPRGWLRGTLAERYESALRLFLLTPRGFYPWAPGFGSTIHLWRTQSVNEADASLIEAELRAGIGAWIPDIQIVGVHLDQNPDDFTLTVSVVWQLPSVTPSAKEPILRPRTTTVTY